MKNASGASSATPLIPIADNRWVAIAKMITPVQNMEQKIAAIKHARKNHFISMSVKGMFRQRVASVSWTSPIDQRKKVSAPQALVIVPLKGHQIVHSIFAVRNRDSSCFDLLGTEQN
jgi:hypothetical protein